jgi:hypothetical protein
MVLQIFKEQLKIETFEAEAKLEDKQLYRNAQGRGKDGSKQVHLTSPPFSSI